MAPILGYWAIRGRAQPIRFLLEFTGTEYEDKQYNFGPPPTFDASEWRDEKTELGLLLPNLPYYIDEDEDIKITETSAILRHLARKNNLVGSSETDMIKVDMAFGLIDGMNTENAALGFNRNFEDAKEAYVANIGGRLQKLSDLLGDGDYILGDEMSFVDFCLNEALDRFEMIEPDCISAFSSLKAFHDRISELSAIAEYLESEKFEKIKTRFNVRMALVGAGEYESDES